LKPEPEPIESIEEYFRKYHEKKARRAEELQDEPPIDQESEEEEGEEIEEKVKEQKPKDRETREFEKREGLCFKITSHVNHQIFSQSHKVRSLSLHILTETFKVIGKDEKVRLPPFLPLLLGLPATYFPQPKRNFFRDYMRCGAAWRTGYLTVKCP